MICIGQLCKHTVQKILVSIDWSDVMVLLENIWIEASWSYSPCLQFKERPIDYQSAVNKRPFISQCSHVSSHRDGTKFIQLHKCSSPPPPSCSHFHSLFITTLSYIHLSKKNPKKHHCSAVNGLCQIHQNEICMSICFNFHLIAFTLFFFPPPFCNKNVISLFFWEHVIGVLVQLPVEHF